MRDDLKRVGITGASGGGVTTLGAALAERIGAVHIDTDDHFWIATQPPYQVQRDVPGRLERIRAEQARTGRWGMSGPLGVRGLRAERARAGRWVMSGTLDGWAEPAIGEAELIVFLQVPTHVRLERLR